MIVDPAGVFDLNGARLPFGQDMAVFGHAVAAAAYSVDLTAFQAAGFGDLSCRVNSDIMTGFDFSGGATLRDSLSSAAQTLMARARMRFPTPAAQLRGSLYPDDNDHAKAVFMSLDRGAYTLIVIGFTGTMMRLDDWVPNFDVRDEEDWHRGFLNLTKEIEEAEEKISFPEAAARLGTASCTLRDVMDECARENARFRVFFAGHSQGAAVMQIYASRLVERGVRPEHIAGIGFAPPSVSYERRHSDAEECLCHFISSDDLVPRVGARYHVGECRVLPMTDAFRAALYGRDWKKPAFRAALGLTTRLRTSAEALLFTTAMLDCLVREQFDPAVAEGASFLTGLRRAISEKRDQYLGRLRNAAAAGYLAASGEAELPPARLTACRRSVRALFARYGTAEGFVSLVQCIRLAHRLAAPHADGGPAVYHLMVTDGWPLTVCGLEEPLISPLALPDTAAGKPVRKRPRGRGLPPMARRPERRR